METRTLLDIKDKILSSFKNSLHCPSVPVQGIFLNETIDLLQEAFLIEDRTEADNLYLHEMTAIVGCFTESWSEVMRHVQAAKKIDPHSFRAEAATAFQSLYEIELHGGPDYNLIVTALNHCVLAICEFAKRYPKPEDFTQKDAGLDLFILRCLLEASKNVIHSRKSLPESLRSIQYSDLPQDSEMLQETHKELWHNLKEFKFAAEELISICVVSDFLYPRTFPPRRVLDSYF